MVSEICLSAPLPALVHIVSKRAKNRKQEISKQKAAGWHPGQLGAFVTGLDGVFGFRVFRFQVSGAKF